MTKRQRIIITGANGFIGKELVRYFSDNGYIVHALVRTPGNFTNTKNVTYFHYDLTKAPGTAPFEKADSLIHAAYIKNGNDVVNRNIVAAKQLLETSRKHGIKKNVFISSMSVGKNAPSAYGRQKYLIEQLFNGSQDIVIRPGLVIGNGGLAKQIIDFMRSMHVAPLIGGGRQPIQFVGVSDLAKSIGIAIEKNLRGTLSVATPQVYTYKEFYRAVKQKMKIHALIIPVPYFVPLFIIRLIRLLRLPFAVTEDNLKGLQNLRAHDTQADLNRIGITLAGMNDLLEGLLRRKL